MENLIHQRKEKSDDYPGVSLLFNEGKGEIYGESFMEDPEPFYNPVMDWIRKYFETKSNFTFDIKLVYHNTSSSKAIHNILELLKEAADLGKHVAVNWYYDPDDEEIIYEIEDHELEVGILINKHELIR